jgi:tripartite-type tricarboxylate transporter receptor subunit TctC
MSFTSLAAAQGLMQSGKIRAVAVTSLERMPQIPDVAPLQDGAPGLKGYELLNWFGVFTTGGTPPAIVKRLNELVEKTIADPKTGAILDKQGIVARKTTAAEFGAFVQSETKKFAGVIEKAKITVPN